MTWQPQAVLQHVENWAVRDANEHVVMGIASEVETKSLDPDRALFLLVIVRAHFDALLKPHGVSRREILDAHEFFYDGRLEIFCHYCGIQPERVRKVYEKNRRFIRDGGKLSMPHIQPDGTRSVDPVGEVEIQQWSVA
jgi:hypothetical protein